ncbi:N-acetyl sugar amidotransferase [Aquirufa antheringensis]|uniref:N-acetyl sugar amidotransferase n=1 Tax=Aquirufa antheringensis TaxID=2516559 RepID=UPI0022A981A0|nr:N-acetyl sugar amidotransferase [Aquirufa antheringensis]MCZ2484746.1 N-acetyl sugar amidotransferase [Aquirufa antheringensis]
MQYCKNCLMPETRPRIQFDEDGICNACSWSEEKKIDINWASREKELAELVNFAKNRNKDSFDVIAPSSGGKDSSYVAYKLKELGLNPLTITLKPPLPFEIGEKNLESFINSGFDHVHITPNYELGSQIAKKAFIEHGQPMFAWIISVQTAIFRCAVLFDIPLVMFGEEGEVEYGGSSKLKNKATYNLEDSIKLYLSGQDPKEFTDNKFTDKQLYWWRYPSTDDFKKLNPSIAHWSYFENWDPYRNYMIAKEKYGLEESNERSIGTYTNFAQTDTKLYDLHAYLMFLKFGFGRCTQDVGIDIRRGALTRKQGLELVRLYDGEYPEPYIEDYLKYFKMTIDEFNDVLDSFANKNVLHKVNGRWKLIEKPL